MDLKERDNFEKALWEAAEKNGLHHLLNKDRLTLFYRLFCHMDEVGKHMNLTAIREPERIITLHFIDCLAAAAFFPEGASVIDVGCGAGFPTLPLAICRPDLHITALDATAKRVNYVAETAALLGLAHTKTLCARAEDAAKDPSLREAFDVATGRAVAALPVLCELCLPFIKIGGAFIAMKGKNAPEECAAAEKAFRLLGGSTATLHETPLTGENGETFSHTTVLVAKEKKTPALYPRPYAKILKSPL